MATKTQKGLPIEALPILANIFKALSEEPRLRILMELKKGERNISELVAATEMTQPNVSRHVQKLVDAGILGRRKEAQSVYYSIADASIFEICDKVCGSVQKEVERKQRIFAQKSNR